MARAARPAPVSVQDLKTHVLAGYIPDLLFTTALDFSLLADHVEVTPAVRSTSVMAQVNAVLSGAALGVLPHFLAAAHGALIPLLPNELTFTRSYWISVHDDLRRLNRVRAVVDALQAAVREDRALFAGRRPGPTDCSA